jgi:hypothetical protein
VSGSDARSVEAVIVERVKRWLQTQARRVRDEGATASIKFSIQSPCGDDDNTLILDLHVEEKVHDRFDETDGLRVEGVAFDTDVKPGDAP